MLGELGEQAIFLRFQMNVVAGAANPASKKIDLEIVDPYCIFAARGQPLTQRPPKASTSPVSNGLVI